MSVFRSERLAQLIKKIPGYKRFREFTLVPIFFISGAALEFVMINWHVGEANFYRTFKRRQAQEQAEAIVNKYIEKKNLENS